MEGKIKVYSPSGEELLSPLITVEAAHEEELMRSDFVKLSWADAEWMEIPIGAYIIPFTDVIGVDGQYAHFTLYQSYKPEKTSEGYRYEPEFQHPKMWLRYVPYYFTTQNASGDTVQKTEYPFTGQLGLLLSHIVGFINDVYNFAEGVPEFQVNVQGVDATQTVSVSFSNMDVLSAIEEVTKVVGCEYHIDWDNKVIWFGKVLFGETPYDLVVDDNVGVPTINRSKDIYYNCFKVYGSSRNNYRSTENGNIAVNDRLTLDATLYPDSVIDLRSGNEPAITTVMMLDDVYPHLELYLYDIHERKKYKKDADGNITTERWSVWYFKLAYIESGQWHEFKLYESANTEATDISEELIETDLPLPKYIESRKVGDEEQLCVEVRVEESPTATFTVGTQASPRGDLVLVPYIGDEEEEEFDELKRKLHVNPNLEIIDGADLTQIPAKYVSSSAIDGLAPSLAFIVNDRSAIMSPLGTREFEVKYNTVSVSFDEADDVEGQTGLDAGYYEIIHTEEGSDNLIVPTTSEQGIIPMGNSQPSIYNNKCFIFNVAIDGYKEQAQAELATKAREKIADDQMDTNNYVFPCNPVAFEAENQGRHPEMYIGRKVRFKGDGGLDLVTRILKLNTKLDYGFQQTITVGNKMIQGQYSVMKQLITDLQGKSGSWENVTVIGEGGDRLQAVEYEKWESGALYYHETYNRAKGWIEQSYVWHRGKKWMCLRSLTTEEPQLGCNDWKVVEGDQTWDMVFYDNQSHPYNNVIPVYPGYVDLWVSPRVYWGGDDVTSRVSTWQWHKYLADGTEDTSWASEAAHKVQTIHLTDHDMPAAWGRDNPVVFECIATLQGIDVEVAKTIGFN